MLSKGQVNNKRKLNCGCPQEDPSSTEEGKRKGSNVLAFGKNNFDNSVRGKCHIFDFII